MSDLNDENTRAAVAQAQERLRTLLDRFASPGASWDDYPSMGESYLEYLQIDLDRLSACITQRAQEKYQTHEPIDFG